MSRHAVLQSDGSTIIYGYDRPMQEYFIHKEVPGEDNPEFAIGNYFTTIRHPDYPEKRAYNNSELLEILDKFENIPQSHLDCIVMDLPIP